MVSVLFEGCVVGKEPDLSNFRLDRRVCTVGSPRPNRYVVAAVLVATPVTLVLNLKCKVSVGGRGRGSIHNPTFFELLKYISVNIYCFSSDKNELQKI